jgi:hypothetical protein
MGARLLEAAEVTVNILGKDMRPEEIARSSEFSDSLSTSLQAMVTSCSNAAARE